MTSDIPVAFQGEVMLHGWADSNRTGRTVTLRLPEDDLEHPFRKMATPSGKIAGQRFMAVLVMIDDEESPVKEAANKPYGKNVRELHREGWFFDRRVLNAIGSPDEFRAWCTKQPCIVCKNPPVSNVLRGPGHTGLPVCNLHRHADIAGLATHQPRLLKAWVSESIAKAAGVESMGFILPSHFSAICESLGIRDTIPEDYFQKEE